MKVIETSGSIVGKNSQIVPLPFNSYVTLGKVFSSSVKGNNINTNRIRLF